jgi:hypothetical protein
MSNSKDLGHMDEFRGIVVRTRAVRRVTRGHAADAFIAASPVE